MDGPNCRFIRSIVKLSENVLVLTRHTTTFARLLLGINISTDPSTHPPRHPPPTNPSIHPIPIHSSIHHICMHNYTHTYKYTHIQITHLHTPVSYVE